jgi:hypothetical protein
MKPSMKLYCTGYAWLLPLGIKRLLIFGDSAVVINQVHKEWDRIAENVDAYCDEVCKLEKNFYGLELHHVIRDNNIAADTLAKLGSIRVEVPVDVFVQELYKPSIKEHADDPSTSKSSPPECQIMVINLDWTTPFIEYLTNRKVPTDKTEAERITRHSKNYVVIGDKLFWHGASLGVLMKCISNTEGKELLEEIHSGIYGNHAASRTLVG